MSVAFSIIAILLFLAVLVGEIYFVVWTFIWEYRMFQAVKKPGWWALIPLYGMISYILGLALIFVFVPLGIIFILAFFGFSLWSFIVIGIAAWSKE